MDKSLRGDEPLVLEFSEVGRHDLDRVGGKGANLGALAAAGLPVPPGFCVTTYAYKRFVAAASECQQLLDALASPELDALASPELDALARPELDALARHEPHALPGPEPHALPGPEPHALEGLEPDDLEGVRTLGAKLRDALTAQPIPLEVREAVLGAWRKLGAEKSYAVRSSATAEDLPDASFAGQQDTYLNVVGEEALLRSTRACWASLFTDRAIVYRRQNGIPHSTVSLSVVIQEMVQPDKSGILFTADPVSGHRKMTVIDAGFGLGEALVSGLIDADHYKMDRRTGELVERKVGDKKLAIVPLEGGGTERRELPEAQRKARVLDDDEVATLVALGDRIQRLYEGAPQDIEWCLAGGETYIVQARPITTLFPLMSPRPDGEILEVGASIGHAQMMTDPLKPMGLSTIKSVLPLGRRITEPRECPWIRTAGGRLYLEVGRALRFAPTRKLLLTVFPVAEPLTARALAAVAARPELRRGPRLGFRQVGRFARFMVKNLVAELFFRPVEGRIETINQDLDRKLEAIRGRIEAGEKPEERLRRGQQELQLALSRVIHLLPKLGAGVLSGKILLRLCRGHEAEVTALGRGLHGNVTTEMDLAVGDLADKARAIPELRSALLGGETRLVSLAGLPGGEGFQRAMQDFLTRYGMRGPGEFDLSRERWRDAPGSLLKMVAGNLGHDEPGAHRAHLEALSQQAERAAEALSRLSWGPKRLLIRRFVRVHRNLMPVREHPKFFLVRLMEIVRNQILEAGSSLVAQGRIERPEDVFFLELPELIELIEAVGAESLASPTGIQETGFLSANAAGRLELRTRIQDRQAAYQRYLKLTPPRVLTSEGECPQGIGHAPVPEGALAGAGVSAGIVEGLARVVIDPTNQVLNKGDILVAPFTDPGWTPLFINASAVVLEVGGFLTHGSVIAREYGIPAVVCVPEATRIIKSGQRIQVNGDEGWVRLLDQPKTGEEIR